MTYHELFTKALFKADMNGHSMRCPNCGGTGHYVMWNRFDESQGDCCPRCNGYGRIIADEYAFLYAPK